MNRHSEFIIANVVRRFSHLWGEKTEAIREDDNWLDKSQAKQADDEEERLSFQQAGGGCLKRRFSGI